MIDANYISSEFQSVSSGYLSTPAHDLGKILRCLPEPMSEREFGIAAAIRHGARFPEHWESVRKPLKLKRTPAEAMATDRLWAELKL